ncbi:MAG: hypothetical protein NT036_02470 [Candidatus Omnitrophica bacterium]|nr:hypothetical protein [Candidatus Omnitrophota bacterium]
MTKAFKIAAAIFLIAAALGASPSYCADESKTSHYEGRIAYLDWVGSKMILNGVGQMEFYVPRGTRIRKLGGSISFSDLNILDNAIVNYYEDPSGKNIAVRITITVV